ncbi:hypothetical protein J2J97_32290 (plasmid) [Rhizobium bangladeshense]|uniref:hypothetical protein n=1 Tax=Rhizobium bangladeshense TaxID=1138189 RepID=UPI001A984163|nr:hypothetical protein [Rhizobium bangladeshense]QSY98585.1 hypothetical protein J2J97_32290 [Rhizobium bangladeshense]
MRGVAAEGRAYADPTKTEGNSAMTKVRADGHGLFVIAGGYAARPGDVLGYSHAFRMDDGGLKEGDTVKASHWAGTPTTKIKLGDGTVLLWGHDPAYDPIDGWRS